MIFSWISDTLLRQKYTKTATRGALEKSALENKCTKSLPSLHNLKKSKAY